MKGIVVPPQEADFTADPVELYFDLAFVFAFSRLVYILMAAALEEITLHPKDTLAPEFRWMLFGGLAAFSAGVAISVFRAFGVVARERTVGLALMLVLTLVGGSMTGLTLLVLTDLLVVVVLVAEHLRIEGVGSATNDDPVDYVASA